MRTFLKSLLVPLFTLVTGFAFASADSTAAEKKTDYQIFLRQPAKEIKLIMYENNFLPIQGKLSEDRKSVIMKNYQTGMKVRVKVVYDDGTVDEFVKTPCYIDPVILAP